MTRYNIYFTRKALEQLNKLDEKDRKRLLEALVVLRDYGFTVRLDIKKLRGYKNHYRLRVGGYRVLFELEKPNKIIVYAVLPRKKAYRRK